VGRSESGKTLWAKNKALDVVHKKPVFVLDPIRDPEWFRCSHFCTDDRHYFLDMCKRNKGCILIIDEAPEHCGHHDKESFWLATRSRHLGHSVFFIAQRGKMVSPTVRSQCTRLIMFNQGPFDCRELWQDFGHNEIKDRGPKLKQFQYLDCRLYQPAKSGKVGFIDFS